MSYFSSPCTSIVFTWWGGSINTRLVHRIRYERPCTVSGKAVGDLGCPGGGGGGVFLTDVMAFGVVTPNLPTIIK